MSKEQKLAPEPEFEGSPEDFFKQLKNKIKIIKYGQGHPLFQILEFPGVGAEPNIRVGDFVSFVREKPVKDIMNVMKNGVLYIDASYSKTEPFIAIGGVMIHGCWPLAKAGIIDVRAGRPGDPIIIDQNTLMNFGNEPIEKRKARISDAFTKILRSDTVSSVGQKKGISGGVSVAKGKTSKERSDLLDSNVLEIGEKLSSFRERFNEFASIMEERVGKIENGVSLIKREHGQMLDEILIEIKKLSKHPG